MKAQSLLTFSFLLADLVVCSHLSLAQDTSASNPSASQKLVVLPAETQSEFTSIPMDQELYSGTTSSWRDLRLLDSNEKEIPFLIHRRVKEERKSQHLPTAIAQPQLRPIEDNGLEIEFTIDRQKHPHSIDGITLATQVRDFEHRVTVETRTSDSGPWRSLVASALIYDYSRYMDVRNLEVPFTEKSTNTEETQFRILIERVTQDKEFQVRELTRSMKNGVETEQQEKLLINRENLQLDRISFWHNIETIVSSEPVLSDYPLSIESRYEDEKSKETVLQLISHREPLSRLQLETADRNFHRKVTLYAVEDDPVAASQRNKEVRLTQSSITKISLPNISRSDLAIDFPATRSQRYRLVIDNGDSPPLQDITLTAKGETYEILFLAQPGNGYSVVYGNPLLEAPKYDTLAIQTAVASKITATVGAFQAASPYKMTDPRTEWEKILENRWLLGTLFTFLLMVLVLTLRQASKRLSSISPTAP